MRISKSNKNIIVLVNAALDRPRTRCQERTIQLFSEVVMDLSFKDVEALFAARHGVRADHRIAFRGRLQHLQRLRFPDGVNTGKGRPAAYDWPQLVQLGVALDLIDLGMTPDVSAAIVRLHTPKLLKALHKLFYAFPDPEEFNAAVRSGRCPFEITFFVITTASALSGLSAKPEAAKPWLHILSGAQLLDLFTNGDTNAPTSAVFDFGMRICLLIKLIAVGAGKDPSLLAADLAAWLKASEVGDAA